MGVNIQATHTEVARIVNELSPHVRAIESTAGDLFCALISYGVIIAKGNEQELQTFITLATQIWCSIEKADGNNWGVSAYGLIREEE